MRAMNEASRVHPSVGSIEFTLAAVEGRRLFRMERLEDGRWILGELVGTDVQPVGWLAHQSISVGRFWTIGLDQNRIGKVTQAPDLIEAARQLIDSTQGEQQ